MRNILFSTIVLASLLMPSVAGAALFQLPLVPCGSAGQVPCSPCHLFEFFHNIIDFVLYGVTGPVAAALVVVAGGYMLLSRGNATMYGKGRTLLQNTLIGVSIILLSWVFTNFLIKSLAKGNAYDGWNQFTCPASLSTIVNIETTFPSVLPPEPISTSQTLAAKQAVCSSPQTLANTYHTPLSNGQNAPSLTKMMSCIEADPIVAKLFDTTPSQHGTYDQTHPTCNRTRGNAVCDTVCSHGTNRESPSCHYGGKNGNQGAMAVDYNARSGVSVTYVIKTRQIVSSATDKQCFPPAVPGASPTPTPASGPLCRTVTGELGLFQEIYRVATTKNCQYKLIFYEGTGRGAFHTHMSAVDCDSDAKGMRPEMSVQVP